MRYGHQPLSEIERLPVERMVRINLELQRLLRAENALMKKKEDG